ncbi:MAG TPA: nitroreductase family protein [Actinophytocola sp.]|nr:nitroreductase family protein [Actinophytocola sp.]
MEFQDVVRRRRMIRRFHPDRPVPAEALDRILHNATRGPSAGFSQGQAFLVLEGADLAKFWALRPKGNDVSTAPLLIVPLSCKRVYLDRYAQPDKGWTDRDESRWPVPFWHIDTGMAALLILQTAVDLGLGALYFGIMPDDVPRFRDLYGVPDDHEPIGAVAIGYPDEPEVSGSPRTRARRPAEEVVHRGAW